MFKVITEGIPYPVKSGNKKHLIDFHHVSCFDTKEQAIDFALSSAKDSMKVRILVDNK